MSAVGEVIAEEMRRLGWLCDPDMHEPTAGPGECSQCDELFADLVTAVEARLGVQEQS